MNEIHEANRKRWEAASDEWARGGDRRGVWRRSPTEPALVLCDRQRAHLGDLTGKDVCVLGSGDHEVAFALAGMGGRVTSVDISQRQLDVGKQRADELRLPMAFVQADVTDLSAIASDSFDVVYTGGHVAVWVSDLNAYYAEAARILRPGGLLMIAEYHPFRRVWRESASELVVGYPYFNRGPFAYDVSTNLDGHTRGPMKSYEFHWTVADFLNAVLRGGCRVVEVHEFGETAAEWEGAPMHGLPECLLIVGRREGRR